MPLRLHQGWRVCCGWRRVTQLITWLLGELSAGFFGHSNCFGLSIVQQQERRAIPSLQRSKERLNRYLYFGDDHPWRHRTKPFTGALTYGRNNGTFHSEKTDAACIGFLEHRLSRQSSLYITTELDTRITQ